MAEKDDKSVTYILEKRLGAGAIGAVHLAHIKETGKMVAIKLVQQLPSLKDELESLIQEVNLLKTLDHPHIVKYLATYDQDGRTGLVLEYMAGGSVFAQLKEFGPFNEAVCQKYTTHILMGLQYLHSKNVMHRDIKCANILLDGNAVAKLADFGISKYIEGTAMACSMGTIHYMAPELLDQKPYNKTADIWGVGCAMVEMLTGGLPWKSSSAPEALRRILAFTFDKEMSPYLPPTATNCVRDFLQKCFLPKETRWDADHLMKHEFCKKYRATEVKESKPLKDPVTEMIKFLSNTYLNKYEEWDIVKNVLGKIQKIEQSTSKQDIYKILSCLYFEWVPPEKLKNLQGFADIIPHHNVLQCLIEEAIKYQILTGVSSAPKDKASIVRPKQRPLIGLIGGSRMADGKVLLYQECEVFSITGDQAVLKIPDLPTKCTANTVVSDEHGNLYKVGGQILDEELCCSMLKYKVNAGKWVSLPPMQVPRSRHVAVFVRGHIIVFGGSLEPTWFEIFNTSDYTWQRKENFPLLLLQAAGCECDGDVFACGGYTKKGEDIYFYKGILQYLFEDNSWNRVGHMLHQRKQHVMAAVNHKIYIAGGEDTTTLVEMFDPATGQSTLLPDMPCGCFNTTMVSYQHFLITLSLDGENLKKHILIYNSKTATWSDFEITLPRIYDIVHMALLRL